MRDFIKFDDFAILTNFFDVFARRNQNICKIEVKEIWFIL